MSKWFYELESVVEEQGQSDNWRSRIFHVYHYRAFPLLQAAAYDPRTASSLLCTTSQRTAMLLDINVSIILRI